MAGVNNFRCAWCVGGEAKWALQFHVGYRRWVKIPGFHFCDACVETEEQFMNGERAAR